MKKALKKLLKVIIFLGWVASIPYGLYLILITATLVDVRYTVLVVIQMMLAAYGMYRIIRGRKYAE